MTDMTLIASRLEAMENRMGMFGSVNLGDYGQDQDYPLIAAMRINPALVKAIIQQQQYIQATIVQAVQLMVQVKLTKEAKQAEILLQTVSEIIDDWCGTPPRKFPFPKPKFDFSDILKELTQLADTYPEGTIRREATFELSRRLLDKAANLHSKTGKSLASV